MLCIMDSQEGKWFLTEHFKERYPRAPLSCILCFPICFHPDHLCWLGVWVCPQHFKSCSTIGVSASSFKNVVAKAPLMLSSSCWAGCSQRGCSRKDDHYRSLLSSSPLVGETVLQIDLNQFGLMIVRSFIADDSDFQWLGVCEVYRCLLPDHLPTRCCVNNESKSWATFHSMKQLLLAST